MEKLNKKLNLIATGALIKLTEVFFVSLNTKTDKFFITFL